MWGYRWPEIREMLLAPGVPSQHLKAYHNLFDDWGEDIVST
jgi:hypothetical protein